MDGRRATNRQEEPRTTTKEEKERRKEVGVRGKEKRSKRSGSLFPAVQVVLGRLEKFRVGAPAVGRFDVICWDEAPGKVRGSDTTHPQTALLKREKRRKKYCISATRRNSTSNATWLRTRAKPPISTNVLLSPHHGCSHRESLVFGFGHRNATTSSTHPHRPPEATASGWPRHLEREQTRSSEKPGCQER